MFARQYETHFAQQVIGFGMRPFEHAYLAVFGQAQRGIARHRQGLRIDIAPGAPLEPPQHRARNHRSQSRHIADRRLRQARYRGSQQPAGKQRKQQVHRQHQRVAPGGNGLERGVDHGGAGHGDHRQQRKQDACNATVQSAIAGPGQPQRWQVTQHGGNALAGQPRTAPLAEGAPGTQRLAKVQGGREQSRRYQHEAQRQPDQRGRARGQVSSDGHHPQPEPQSVTGAGKRREKDDGKRRMHQRLNARSSQRSKGGRESPSSFSVCCTLAVASGPARRARGGRYLLTGA